MNKKLLKQHMLYVTNLSGDTTEDDLRRFFSQYGLVTGVMLKRDRITGESWRHGYIQMESPFITKIAIQQADGQILNNNQLTVLRVRR